MAEAFDPYHIWLGIPPDEQPADHYRLLGICRFESNLDVIANAADQRVRHLRSMQTGKRQAETQKLLNEIASVAAVLSDPIKKRKYDSSLAAEHHPIAKVPSAATPLTPPAVLPANRSLAISSAANRSVPAMLPSRASAGPEPGLNFARWFAIGGLSAGAISLLVVVIAIASQKNRDAAQEVPKTNVAQGNSPQTPAGEPTKPSPVTTVVPSPQVTPTPPTISPAPASTPPPNPDHQKNWEYGYGRIDSATGKVSEFHPLIHSVVTDPSGNASVLWGAQPVYPAQGPLNYMNLDRLGGHPCGDPNIVVIRRWKHSLPAFIELNGEVEHGFVEGDGIRASLISGMGSKLWSETVKNSKIPISVKRILLQSHETLDFCVDCNTEVFQDFFRYHLVLQVRLLGRTRQESRSETWDSISDYTAPVPPAIATTPQPSAQPIKSSHPPPEVAPSISAAPTPAAPARLSIPDEAVLAAARAKLKETFGDLAQKSKKPDDRRKLSTELRRVADSETDPALRFALLDAARRLAMSGQDVRSALLVAAEIAKLYETDPLDQQLQTLKLASGTTLPAAAWEEAATSAIALAESGRDKGQIELADGTSLLAVEFAAKGKNLEQRKQVKQLRDAVLAYRKSAALAKQAEELLQTKPDDPAANLVAGKWYCFFQNDWAKGLAYFEKCGEPALVTAALAEKDPQNSLAIADAWYAAVDKLQRSECTAVQRRAHDFYALATKELMGLDQIRANKRLEELKGVIGPNRLGKGTASATIPPKNEKLDPGLIVRVVSGSQAIPTPILGTTMNWDGIVWDNLEVASRKVLDLREISASPLATGYIQLDRNDAVVFTLRNAYCLIDGEKFPPIFVNQKGQDLNYLGGRTEGRFEKQLTMGRHSLLIGRIPMNTGSGVEFKVKRSGGGDCLFHSLDDLEAELAKAVLLPNGARTKGVLLFGNLRFSR